MRVQDHQRYFSSEFTSSDNNFQQKQAQTYISQHRNTQFPGLSNNRSNHNSDNQQKSEVITQIVSQQSRTPIVGTNLGRFILAAKQCIPSAEYLVDVIQFKNDKSKGKSFIEENLFLHEDQRKLIQYKTEEESKRSSVFRLIHRHHLMKVAIEGNHQRNQSIMMPQRNKQLSPYVADHNENLFSSIIKQNKKESPQLTQRYLDELGVLLQTSNDGKQYKSSSHNTSIYEEKQEQKKTDAKIQNKDYFALKRLSQSRPNNHPYNLKTTSNFLHINGLNQYAYDTQIAQIKLVGSQFQSKATPDIIINNLVGRRKSTDSIDSKEIIMQLKKKQQPTYNRQRQNDSSYNDLTESIMKDKGESRQPSVSKQYPYKSLTQSISHRKLEPQMNTSQQEYLQTPILEQFKQYNSNSRQSFKKLGANLEKKSESFQAAPTNSYKVYKTELPSEHEQQPVKRNSVKTIRVIKRGVSQQVNNQSLSLQQSFIDNENERIERLYKFQKKIKAKYNEISKKTYGKEEPYRYILIRGNNSELVKKCLDDRNGDWMEIQCTNTLFNFKWAPFSKGIRFDYLSSHGQKKLVNHFEYHDQITEKDNLYFNMARFYDTQRKNVFNYLPVTFVFDLSSSQSNTEIERFQTYFNILEKHKSETPDYRLALINKELSHHLQFPSAKSKSYMKYTLCNNMFEGSNYWLIKPTDLNRGRGVQVFNSIEQLRKLITEYQQGVQLKFPQSSISNGQSNKSVEAENIIQKRTSGQNISSNHQAIPAEQVLTNFTNLENIPNIVKTDAFVIQKYLERPLLIKKRKFDIRLWVLVTHENKCYLFKEGYIRTSSFEYELTPQSINKPFIHLTNNAVQKFNDNYGVFEEGNQLSFKSAQSLLNEDGVFCDLYNMVNGSIANIIKDTIKAAENKINSEGRKFCMEIFGYDFIIDQQLNPWLIEVNTNPCLELSSGLLKDLIPRMIDDALKLTVDTVFPPKRQRLSGLPQDKSDLEKQSILTLISCCQDEPLSDVSGINALGSDLNKVLINQGNSTLRATIKQEAPNLPDDERVQQPLNENRTQHAVAGYGDSENMWNLIYQLKV